MCWLSFELKKMPLGCLFSFGVATFASAVLLTAFKVPAQEKVSRAAQLPLPAHPDRLPEKPEHTLPKESQPERHSRHTQIISRSRTQGHLPVPGHPGRNLLPPGAELEDTDDVGGEADTDIEPELPPGLLDILPHSWRDGGWTWEYVYTGETFTKATGGLSARRATNYRSNFDLVSIIDTAQMNWWDGGRLFVYGQNLSGKPISTTDVGDVQLFSNLDSTISATERPRFTTVAEYWYEHFSLDNDLRLKLGKQDANVDFALTDLGGEFVHSSFGLPPMIPMPTFPSQALGIASFVNLTDTIALGAGVYDGTLPSGPQGVRWGFDTLGHNGAITLFQVELKPQLGPAGLFPNTTRIGGWHHSDDEVWLRLSSSSAAHTFSQNYGYWLTTDQMVYREGNSDEDDQGLGMFFQFGWAPSNRNALTEYYGGGLVYKGLIPNRDQDYLGAGFANALFSRGIREVTFFNEGVIMDKHETAVEVFYKYIASPYFSLQPDIQFIANPGGRFQDALVPGLRFELVL